MIKRILSVFTLVAAIMLASSPARADWYEASSDHFVIYADDKEKDIKRFAENLERYHSAMVYVLGRNVEKPSPSNRVVIFVAGNQKDIRKIAGTNNRRVAGFYIPRAGASRAFVQDIRNKDGYPDFSTIILLHEYAHHFLISSSRFEMPRWLSEGAAEFFAAATFQKDGGVLIGRVARHRAPELAYSVDVSVEELLDHELYEANRSRRHDAFYGRSWLMFHYLTFSQERRGQLPAYERAVYSGTSSMEAGKEAFGDLKRLQKDLDRYMRGRSFRMLALEPELLPIGEITLRKLPEGEAEVMPLRMRSQRGVNREQAEKLVVEVREIAAKYSDDPGVLSALAEAEYDSGNNEAAIAAADKAIAIDPARTNPYVQKGFALFRMARDADDADAAYDAAMKPFTALNKRENDHPLPLIYYYRSYAQRGIEPPDNAKHALERAGQLAPFDKTLWFNIATMQMNEGKIALAKRSLQPIANDPHGGGGAEAAKRLVALLDRTEEGTVISRRVAASEEATEMDDPSQGHTDDNDAKDGESDES